MKGGRLGRGGEGEDEEKGREEIKGERGERGGYLWTQGSSADPVLSCIFAIHHSTLPIGLKG